MPYLQLDVNGRFGTDLKKLLAQKLCETYAEMMQVDIRRISVAIRELGEGSVWRMIDGESTPAAVLMCDIRRGRSAERRMEVAKALCMHCEEILGLREDRLNVEFTQHSGDEMYHPTLGGYSPEWSDDEAQARARATMSFADLAGNGRGTSAVEDVFGRSWRTAHGVCFLRRNRACSEGGISDRHRQFIATQRQAPRRNSLPKSSPFAPCRTSFRGANGDNSFGAPTQAALPAVVNWCVQA